MVNFDYQTPTRLIFGKGVVAEKLQGVMAKFGDKVLITYGGGSRISEMAHHIAVNEGLDQAWVPLRENDIAAILRDCL